MQSDKGKSHKGVFLDAFRAVCMSDWNIITPAMWGPDSAFQFSTVHFCRDVFTVSGDVRKGKTPSPLGEAETPFLGIGLGARRHPSTTGIEVKTIHSVKI